MVRTALKKDVSAKNSLVVPGTGPVIIVVAAVVARRVIDRQVLKLKPAPS